MIKWNEVVQGKIKVKKERRKKMKCAHCEENLKFDKKEMCWVHLDGKDYKTRPTYPEYCKRCGCNDRGLRQKLVKGYCALCHTDWSKEEINDHSVLPYRSCDC